MGDSSFFSFEIFRIGEKNAGVFPSLNSKHIQIKDSNLKISNSLILDKKFLKANQHIKKCCNFAARLERLSKK